MLTARAIRQNQDSAGSPFSRFKRDFCNLPHLEQFIPASGNLMARDQLPAKLYCPPGEMTGCNRHPEAAGAVQEIRGQGESLPVHHLADRMERQVGARATGRCSTLTLAPNASTPRCLRISELRSGGRGEGICDTRRTLTVRRDRFLRRTASTTSASLKPTVSQRKEYLQYIGAHSTMCATISKR